MDNIIELRREDDDEVVLSNTLGDMSCIYREHTPYNLVISSKYIDTDIAGFTLYYIAEERKAKKFLIFPCIERRIIFDIWKGFTQDNNEKYVSCEVYTDKIHGIAREYIGKYAARFDAKVKMKLSYGE